MSNATCGEPSCEKPSMARGLCVTHYHRWNRATKDQRPTVGTCETCGATVRVLKRYCGPDCRPRCSVTDCEKPVHTQGMCSAHATRATRYGDPLAPRVRQRNVGACSVEVCANPMRKKGMCAGHYASDRAGRYRLGSVTTTVAQLARRDGHLCGLCGCDVDLAARKPDMMRPSIDHIVPVSLGGSNHPNNLQLTHLFCNLSKGNRSQFSLVRTAP